MKPLIVALIANGLFPAVGATILLVYAFFTEPAQKGLSGPLLALILWAFLFVYITYPAMIASTVIAAFVGLYDARIAVGLAALCGMAIVFVRLTGSFAHSMQFRQSPGQAAVMAVAYALCWLVAFFIIARPR